MKERNLTKFSLTYLLFALFLKGAEIKVLVFCNKLHVIVHTIENSILNSIIQQFTNICNLNFFSVDHFLFLFQICEHMNCKSRHDGNYVELYIQMSYTKMKIFLWLPFILLYKDMYKDMCIQIIQNHIFFNAYVYIYLSTLMMTHTFYVNYTFFLNIKWVVSSSFLRSWFFRQTYHLQHILATLEYNISLVYV